MRLLDVQKTDSNDLITLVETSDISLKLENLALDAPELPSRFVCLSHCWGGTKNPHLTTSSSIAANEHGIPVRELPKTFQDAVEMTRALGYRYLWIDSMCIVQDDASDWRLHVTQVAETYRYADVTLGASASKDGTGGLFRKIPRDSETAQRYEFRNAKNTYQVYVRDWPVHGYRFNVQDEADWPLMTRGWALQEFLLSRRFVSFAPEEITWSCGTDRHCQCENEDNGRLIRFDDDDQRWFFFGESFKQDLANVKTGSAAKARDVWNRVVECYTRLRLSFTTDRLPAIAGIANLHGDEYLSGLWKADLKSGISWYLSSGLYVQLPTLGRARNGPSWAWTSAAADLTVATDRHSVNEDDFEIKDIHIVRDHDDEYSEILIGRLTISGSLMPMKITMSSYDDETSFRCSLEHLQANDTPLSLDENLVIFYQDYRLEPTIDEINERLSSVMFFPLGAESAYEGSALHITGLVLVESAPESSEDVDTGYPRYARIGFLNYHLPLSGKSPEWEGWKPSKTIFELL